MKKIIAIAAILVSISFAANAQPGSTGGFDDEPEDVPVDGGISLLAIAGAAYGYKKIIKTKHLSTKQLKPNFKIINK
jgi:hypothetical protein